MVLQRETKEECPMKIDENKEIVHEDEPEEELKILFGEEDHPLGCMDLCNCIHGCIWMAERRGIWRRTAMEKTTAFGLCSGQQEGKTMCNGLKTIVWSSLATQSPPLVPLDLNSVRTGNQK